MALICLTIHHEPFPLIQKLFYFRNYFNSAVEYFKRSRITKTPRCFNNSRGVFSKSPHVATIAGGWFTKPTPSYTDKPPLFTKQGGI